MKLDGESKRAWFLVALAAGVPVALVVGAVTSHGGFALATIGSTAVAAFVDGSDPRRRNLAAVVWRTLAVGALMIVAWAGFRFLRF